MGKSGLLTAGAVGLMALAGAAVFSVSPAGALELASGPGATSPIPPLLAPAIPPGIRAPTPAEQAEMDRLWVKANTALAALQWDEVERLLRQAMEIGSRTYGPKHPEVARVLDGIAYTLQERGRHGEAEPLYRKVLEIRQAVLGERNLDTATSYNTPGLFLAARGRYAEAEPLYRKALEISQAVLG
ncbi:MAG: tetratricopeptide repeat protein, partial [Phenylobacterium sp.]|nr:tetratricopeptide repeat protein [Phenylobacterium sp.]